MSCDLIGHLSNPHTQFTCFICRVHAISISDPAEVICNTIRCLMQQFGVKGVEPSDLIDIVDEYTLGYYGRANKELKGESHN